MSIFVGVVPPVEIAGVIAAMQQPFGDNRLEPHITILPPMLVADTRSWLDAIEPACKKLNAFSVELAGTGHFGKGVLYIQAVSDTLEELHRKLSQVTEPFKLPSKHANAKTYHPHLTLGRLWCGFTKDGFSQMKRLAEQYLSEGHVRFEVNFVRVYEKKQQQRYQKLTDIYFS